MCSDYKVQTDHRLKWNNSRSPPRPQSRKRLLTTPFSPYDRKVLTEIFANQNTSPPVRDVVKLSVAARLKLCIAQTRPNPSLNYTIWAKRRKRHYIMSFNPGFFHFFTNRSEVTVHYLFRLFFLFLSLPHDRDVVELSDLTWKYHQLPHVLENVELIVSTRDSVSVMIFRDGYVVQRSVPSRSCNIPAWNDFKLALKISNVQDDVILCVVTRLALSLSKTNLSQLKIYIKLDAWPWLSLS